MAQDTLARMEPSEKDESVFDEKEEHLLRLEGELECFKKQLAQLTPDKMHLFDDKTEAVDASISLAITRSARYLFQDKGSN